MAFNESYISSQRREGLFSDPSCTEIEWLLLQDCAEKYASQKGFQTIRTSIEVQGKKYNIAAFQKNTGIYRSWLITQSDNADLEGMLMKNAYKFPSDNLLRYLYSNVVFGQSILGLRDVLAKCKLDIPTGVGNFTTSLIYLLNKLGQPIGEHFISNNAVFSQWAEENYPHITSRPWPTHFGYMTR